MIISSRELFFELLDANDFTGIPIYTCNTLIIGSGAAAFNAADWLVDLGQPDIAMVTEGINMGTSRNTGSDKQTYYKLSLCSSEPDSVGAMAKALFEGACVHGDTALVEAALSPQCFFKLVNLGVPFPHDRFGQYAGYKTDHDPARRGTSCGPLTSKYMTEKLEAAVRAKGVPIFDGYRIIALLSMPEEKAGDTGETARVVGALALNKQKPGSRHGLTLFHCTNVIYATGGPSAMYASSVYPPSQSCAHGMAFEIGARGNNVTEWQYGIASTAFRWNLSGSYQQVIPRYISTDKNGNDAHEFLDTYFATPADMLSAVFLKGYQWPFDPRKLHRGGSSIVDLAVYVETTLKQRRVFMDFMHNPHAACPHGEFDFSLLHDEAYTYLSNSGILFGTPWERLKRMNMPAFELYAAHGIDLSRQLLEVAVSAQHNNGGLQVDLWWQSNIRHFFPVGEVCGNFGVYRPGGAALNDTQVGSLRAAQYISRHGTAAPLPMDDFAAVARTAVQHFAHMADQLTAPGACKQPPLAWRRLYQQGADRCAAFIRNRQQLAEQIAQVKVWLQDFAATTLVADHNDLIQASINRDILLTQLVYMQAMLGYMDAGGLSRGSYLIDTGQMDLSGCAEHGVPVALDNGARNHLVQEAVYDPASLQVQLWDKPVRPLPDDAIWFETVYNDYNRGEIIGR